MRTLVPVAALTGVYVGSTYYWPDGYVSVPAPRCRGVTPDGCNLHWRSVEMQGGGSEVQCVKLCARAGMASPPRTAAMMIVEPSQPVLAAGAVPAACQVTIFGEPNFGGVSVASGESQPRLDEAGWQNQIASLQVNSGTWDFFDAPDFTVKSCV